MAAVGVAGLAAAGVAAAGLAGAGVAVAGLAGACVVVGACLANKGATGPVRKLTIVSTATRARTRA